MRIITSKDVANKLSAYLHQQIELDELVDWAENVMMEDDFNDENYDTLRDIVSRLGVADVKTFGLTWEDCRDSLHKLGYQVKVEVFAN
ncbi:MAG: hypothetical protein GWN01_14905 [Nitrosopumilaceae archaeon]|nr:hypothetical protein [Nitrosopumilaceae archaeon]NIU88525.1 hypothetical protein [Nitrosopumilaceae archaeon]NIV66763.1 hypothetical protein [Nitrosopumilaceae archaeon]NIX62739.1 hypothetical protein [Nitrosopumilaceae archaeon]